MKVINWKIKKQTQMESESISRSVVSDSFDPMDCSSPVSSVHGILQTRILECITIHFSRVLPGPGIKPRFPALQTDSLPSEPPEKPQMDSKHIKICLISLESETKINRKRRYYHLPIKTAKVKKNG